MNKTHKTLLTAFIAIAFTTSGAAFLFGGSPTNDQKEDKLSENIDTDNVKLGTSFNTEMKATEANHQDLIQKEPIPKMDNSLERENLIRRYKTLNDRDKVFHVYLFNHGKLVAYYTAKGKVSSVNSKLTQPQQLVGCDRSEGSWKEECVVDSPQLDGSYGTNGNGQFFFDTQGAYIETNMNYIVSERPLGLETPPQVTTGAYSQ